MDSTAEQPDVNQTNINKIKLKYSKSSKKAVLDGSKIRLTKYKPEVIKKVKQKYVKVPSKKVPVNYHKINICNVKDDDQKLIERSEKSINFPDADRISEFLCNSLVIESSEEMSSVDNDISDEKQNSETSVNLKTCLINKSVENEDKLIDNKENAQKNEKKSKYKTKLNLSLNKNKKELDKPKSAIKKVVFRTDYNIEISASSTDLDSTIDLINPDNQKKNAFDFMMSSRYKSIGTNSPGKERPEDVIVDTTEKRNKLKTQKLFLEDWADKKGGTKRKLEEECKDKYIKKALNKRAKRMKNLLTQKDLSNDELIKGKKKKIKVLSDSENSNDSVDVKNEINVEKSDDKNIDADNENNDKENEQKLKEYCFETDHDLNIKTHRKELNKPCTKKKVIIDSDDSDDILIENEINDKQKKSEILSKKIVSPSNENQNSKTSIDDIILSPSLKKTSLLHYFDVTQKTESSVKKSKVEKHTEIESSELIKVKLNFTPKKSKLSVVENNLSISGKSKKIKKKHKRSLSLRKNLDDSEDEQLTKKIDSDENDIFIQENKICKSDLSIKEKEITKKKDEENIENRTEEILDIKKLKSKKKHKTSPKKNIGDAQVDELKEDIHEDKEHESNTDKNETHVKKTKRSSLTRKSIEGVLKAEELLVNKTEETEVNEGDCEDKNEDIGDGNEKLKSGSKKKKHLFSFRKEDNEEVKTDKQVYDTEKNKCRPLRKKSVENKDERDIKQEDMQQNGEKKSKKHKRSLSLKKTSQEIHSDEDCDVQKKCEKPKKGKLSLSLRKSIDKQDEDEIDKPVIQNKSPKTPNNQKFAIKKDKSETPFSPKTWKMKVKLFEKIEPVSETTVSSEDDVFDDEIFPEANKSLFTPTNKNINVVNERLTCSETKKEVKIAPLFLIQSRKSEIIAANEAKKKFLLSGAPPKMKKLMKNQIAMNQVEELKFPIFPDISHIQQRDNSDMDLWDLPNTSLVLPEVTEENFSMDLEIIQIGTFTQCSNNIDLLGCRKIVHILPKTLPHLKYLIKQLKNKCPDYPVYKVFRLLRLKFGQRLELSGPKPAENIEKVEKNMKRRGRPKKQTINVPAKEINTEEKTIKKKRGRPKKKIEIIDDNSEVIVLDDSLQENENNLSCETIWTEKYKPSISEDIIGNNSSVKELKNWLQTWVEYSIEQRTTTKKRKRLNSNSSDDFCSDSDTRDTDTIPQNTVIVIGPNGSGKTSTVNALCNELNINVIELNASSKRPGKKILTDLQEATKSHQVKSTDYVNSFFQKVSQEKQEDEGVKNLTLLFVEDADIVFEDQDEGFINALSTLIASSKRPIIITSSDSNCPHLQKFLSQHKVIIFYPLTSKVLGTWLHILCLVEGLQVDRTQISRLLDWNKGDIRKTVLQLQFWVLSGGDSKIYTNKLSSNLYISPRRMSTEIDCRYDDDNSNLSWVSGDESQISSEDPYMDRIHNTCVECFVSYPLKDKSDFQLSFPPDLGNLWWNMSNILGIKNSEHPKNECEFVSPVLFNTQENTEMNKKDTSELKAVSDLLDSMAFADVVYRQLNKENDFEPCGDYWKVELVNSLSVQENMSDYREGSEILVETSHWLIENNLKYYRELSNHKIGDLDINYAVPTTGEKRWRKKQYKSMECLSEAITVTNQIDRRSLSLDYQSTLRTICRIEQLRSVVNSKRNNRFYHYLRGLNVQMSDSMYDVACKTLSH